VRASSRGVGSCLLGAHVGRRAKRESRLGELRRVPGGEQLGDAEIGEQDPAVAQEDVLGLDVAVHDALLVRVLQCARHLPADAHRLLDAELGLPLEPLPQ
jgi:hypothetical protein